MFTGFDQWIVYSVFSHAFVGTFTCVISIYRVKIMNFVSFLFFDQIFVGILVHFTLKTPEEFGVESELGESAGIKFFLYFCMLICVFTSIHVWV